jgi:hypothetical protein
MLAQRRDCIIPDLGHRLYLRSQAERSVLFALVIGAVIVMSAHEELPAGEGQQFWWFVVGAFCYATVLMLI